MSLASGDVRGLLELEVDALAVLLPERRVQPQGVAGAVDWRLGGRIARWILESRFVGQEGEQLLTLGGDELGARRVFLFGLGDGRDRRAPIAALVDAGVKVLAVAPVDESRPLEDATAWVEVVAEHGRELDTVILLDSEGALGREWAALRSRLEARGLEAEQ
ncbi:MAG: hypothetical protein AAFZ18_09385 [Myxococcota bacterium]